MKPTSEQCRLAIEIGAALLHPVGRPATDLIRAAQARSPILAARLEHVLQAAGDNIPAPVAALAQQFYAAETGEADGPDGRTESLRIRLSPQEKTDLKRQAEEAGLSVGAYVRQVCHL